MGLWSGRAIRKAEMTRQRGESPMNVGKRIVLLALAALTALLLPITHAVGQEKPNILFIMGDDIGWMQPSVYHRGLMVGETPNIDRIANEGPSLTHYYAEAGCTAGR